MNPTTAYYKRYDLGDWEGGIGVFVTQGEHAKVVSIPRLGLSTALVGNYDGQDISEMLMKNRTMYKNPQEMDHFTDLILRDIAAIPSLPVTRKKING